MGWLKKAFKKVNNIARKIDPIGHKVVDKVVAQDSRNVRSIAKLFGGSATGKGLASSLYREADRNVADPQWALAKAAIATATAYAGAAAYGAYAGGGAAAGGTGVGSTAAGGLGGGITGTGGASGMAAFGAPVSGSYLGTAGTASLGAGMGGGASTLAGVGGALGSGYYGGGSLASDGIMAANASNIGPSTLGNGLDLNDVKRAKNVYDQLTGQQGGAQTGLGGGTLGAATTSSGNNMLDAAGGLGGTLGHAPKQEQAWLDQYNQTMNPVQQKLALQKDMKENPDDWGDLAQA